MIGEGPYAPAVLRFQISFPDSYPRLPPLVTFSTDMFHPLITPLSTYMYSTDVQDNGTVSATDAERLPPGGFSLRHGFPDWFRRSSRGQNAVSGRQSSGQQQDGIQTPHRPPPPSMSSAGTPGSKGSAVGASPGFAEIRRNEISTYEVLRYMRSTFNDEEVLDSIPIEAAGNPGAWHAWRQHRVDIGTVPTEASSDANATDSNTEAKKSPEPARKPGEWNWEGVWEERVKKAVTASLSEPVLFGGVGAADDVVSLRSMLDRCTPTNLTLTQIRFLSMEDNDVDAVKDNLLRTLDNEA